MKKFARQFINVLVFFFLLSFFSFVIVKLAPGDPAASVLGVDDIAVSKQDIEKVREEMGFNKPIIVQYRYWLKKVIHLDFGNSLITGKPVVSEIKEAFPATLILALNSILIMFIIAIPLGTASAFYENSVIDKISSVFNIIVSSIPVFWLGFILVDIFSIKHNLLPSMGMGGFSHIILPSLSLGITMAPRYVKLIKTSLIESMGKDYIRAAKARGVINSRIFFFHILRNSLIPIITVFGLGFGTLMGGTLIVEVLFSYPGIGKLAIDAILKRDYAMIQAFILFVGVFIFAINLIVDILYKVIDPSIGIKEVDSYEI